LSQTAIIRQHAAETTTRVGCVDAPHAGRTGQREIIPVEFRSLGTSGITVPTVGMGTWRTFDVATADEGSRRVVVDAALAEKSVLFDTSPMYGRAEGVLSRALEGRREQAIVATKVWTQDDLEAEQQIQRGLDYYGGRVDIYQVHNLIGWPTRLDQLERRRGSGGIRAIGLTHWQHGAFSDLASAMRDKRVNVIQVPYNVLDREVENMILPLASDLGLGVLVMQPLGRGELAALAPPQGALSALVPFGVWTWTQALIKWILSDRRVTAVLPATTRAAHAQDNAHAGQPPWFGSHERDFVARLVTRV
jgi:aryl-alcohol dehydrogenase-like predicted oxidoreductase